MTPHETPTSAALGRRADAAVARLDAAGGLDTSLVALWAECLARYGFASPATQGVLLALLREAWGGRLITVDPIFDRDDEGDGDEQIGWCCTGWDIDGDTSPLHGDDEEDVGYGDTEAEALVAGFEAAAMTCDGSCDDHDQEGSQ